jgi:hypothetical protein
VQGTQIFKKLEGGRISIGPIKKTIQAPDYHQLSRGLFDITVNAITLTDTAPHGWKG